jgi:hypothetical protein
MADRVYVEEITARHLCDTCGYPVYQATGIENGQPWTGWHHVSVADEVFCSWVLKANQAVIDEAGRR